MSVKAIAKNVPMSPRKIGEVVALIRGRTVKDAQVILEHTPRRAAVPVAKLISSVASNATQNHQLKESSLVISAISVGPGFSLKRYRPAAHGRALPYRKRTSIITVEVDGQSRPKPTKKKTESKTATKKAASSKDKETK